MVLSLTLKLKAFTKFIMVSKSRPFSPLELPEAVADSRQGKRGISIGKWVRALGIAGVLLAQGVRGIVGAGGSSQDSAGEVLLTIGGHVKPATSSLVESCFSCGYHR
jgi:hypothetical protein